MKITEAIAVRGENLSSRHGAGGKTMRNLFGVHGEHLKSNLGKGGNEMIDGIGVLTENLSSKNGAGGKTMPNLFGIRKENLKSKQRKGERTMFRELGMRKEHLNSDEGGRTMSKTLGMRWLVVAAGAAMLLVLGAACTKEVEVPGETVIVEKEVVKEVMVPGETVVVEKEVVKTVEVPGETVVVEKEVVKEVPGETMVVTKEVVREVPSGKNYVTDPTTGKVVVAPEYGGTLTYPTDKRRVSDNQDPFVVGMEAGWLIDGVNERLAIGDWAIDRDEFDFKTDYTEFFALTGYLAESWETPDPLTYIFHIRQGVHYALDQDSEASRLVNGRELTADDVVYTLQRNNVLGDFTERPETSFANINLPWESIEAIDKYTVVMKMTEPSPGALMTIISEHMQWILPPEVIEQYGDYSDWKNVVGTGPWMLTDYVEGVSKTFTKNPNYWGFDEKYPENRLPYVDEIRALLMAEEATRLSAMRTGKVDIIHTAGGTMTLDVARSLQKTNPEIEVHSYYQRAFQCFTLNIRNAPFDDVRVRHALQMALDLETINDTYYTGYARLEDPRWNSSKGYYTPFEEWPEELKQYYRYDPEGAEKLLDEAGYPRGADGVRFQTTLQHGDLPIIDLGYAEIAASYWSDIGVDVTINPLESVTYVANRGEHNYEMGTGDMAFSGNPAIFIGFYRSDLLWAREWLGGVETPELTAAYEAFSAATTIEEQQRAFKEFDMALIKQHNQIWGPLAPQFQANQPWVEGFNGEFGIGELSYHTIFARLWIDSELKEAMGH